MNLIVDFQHTVSNEGGTFRPMDINPNVYIRTH